MKKINIVVGLWIWFASTAGWAEESEIHVPFLSEPVAVDGALDEPEWTKAAETSRFLLNESGAAGTNRTELKIRYDANALYLGWVCYDRDIQATYTQHDSQLWDEEVVEFFVVTHDSIKYPGVVDYYELQWNPLGAMFDAIIHNTLNSEGWSTSMKGDWDWNANGMTCAVTTEGTAGKLGDTDQRWTVEARIPFSALDRPAPKPGECWLGNFYRYARDSGQSIELLSLNPTTKPSFHQPKKFIPLCFEPPSSRKP